MGRSINRMQFLRLDFSGERAPLRPPWVSPEPQVVNVCRPCAACVEACLEHVIQTARGGYPEVRFEAGECTFCRACLVSCESGALYEMDAERHECLPPWTAKAAIASHCIAWVGVERRVCGDNGCCGAIDFRPRRGDAPLPMVNPRRCDGCGACFRPCPVGAVVIRVPADAVESWHRSAYQ